MCSPKVEYGTPSYKGGSQFIDCGDPGQKPGGMELSPDFLCSLT